MVSTRAHTPKAKGNTEQFWLKLWMWDLAAMILAAGILVAIGIILSVHNGKPIPQWPLGVNLNSLIATLSTLFRALVMVFVSEGKSPCQMK